MITSLLVLFGGALLVAWAVLYTRTFFSVVWRIFLFLLLLASIILVLTYLASPQAEYRTQGIVAWSIGLVAAMSGLVRSFLFKKA